jgi:photosystem II stability/assembly factor-like uncharacterized protein
MTGWVQQIIPRSDMIIVDLCFTDSLTGFIVNSKYSPSDSTFIFRTFDGGNNWTNPFKDNIYLTSIQFINKNTGYSAGRDVIPINGIIKKTTDGGNNWYTVSIINGSGVLEDVYFANKDTGWVCSTDLTDGGLWRTTNGGLSWQLQLDYNVRPSKIFFVNSNTGWVIGDAQTKLYKTTNCGMNWFLQKDFNVTTTDVFFSTTDTGWLVKSVTSAGYHDGLLRSTNGGNSWDSINAPAIPTESRLYFVDNYKGWAGSGPHKIYVTKDGYNWGYQYSPIFGSDNISFVDSNKGWAGASGFVHTADGGGPIIYTGIKRNGDFIPSFELKQNYPNPFNSSTKILFEIFKASTVDLIIYDITGREITKLISGQEYKNGVYKINFDASKYSLSSGNYFCTMRSETLDHKEIFIDTKKLVYVK